MRKSFYIVSVLMVFMGVLILANARAQSLPAGSPVLDDYYRNLQLLGRVDSNISFTVRPIFPVIQSQKGDTFDPDSTLVNNHWVKAGTLHFLHGYGSFQILPISWQQQINSANPYGWNDGPMIPAKGYQTMISGGIYLQIGPLSIQFRPEYVYAQNGAFNGFTTGHNDDDLKRYYDYFNAIDQPERYGNTAYKKAFLGQSSIRLTFGPVSLGLSNENLWWGPGIRNSLIMSDNAPGFKHITLNTVRPVKTYIGYFEWQVIGARLDGSGLPPLLTTTLSDGTNLFNQKRDDWRYLAGININYHPKWIPGLTFGLIRTFDAYHDDVKGFSNYVPFFFPYQKVNTDDGDPFGRDQITSLYTRWLFLKARAEVYFEYGLNDNSYNYRDFIGSPDHSRAYIFGIRKMIPVNGTQNQQILIGTEITQLSQSPDRITRNSGGWYTHYQVTDGHTNEGQILGAGTGSGGNLQSLSISWLSGIKMLGLSLERYEHGVDFYQAYLPDLPGGSRNWVDLALGLHGNWSYKNLIFNAKLEGVKSLNYEWVLKDYVPGQYYIPHNDVYNLHVEFGTTFRF